jgi:hypothetical protein
MATHQGQFAPGAPGLFPSRSIASPIRAELSLASSVVVSSSATPVVTVTVSGSGSVLTVCSSAQAVATNAKALIKNGSVFTPTLPRSFLQSAPENSTGLGELLEPRERPPHEDFAGTFKATPVKQLG